jgi:hypothetical protein
MHSSIITITGPKTYDGISRHYVRSGFEEEALGACELLSVCLQLLLQKVDVQAPVLLAGLSATWNR